MKQKIYLLGIFSTLVLITGTLLKLSHMPGAGVMFTLGIFFMVIVFLPAAFINNYKNSQDNPNPYLHIISYITCLVIFTSMLFKVMHWPYAGHLLMIALPFPFVVFLPVWLYFTSRMKNFDINNTIFVLFLLALHAVFSALLALNIPVSA